MKNGQIDPDLEQVCQEFQEWQKDRTYRKPIPEDILSRVKQLRSRYPDTSLAAKMGLSYRRLRRALRLYDEQAQIREPHWVELGSSLGGDLPAGSSPPSSVFTPVIEGSSGYRLILKGLSLEQAIQAFRSLS